MKLDADPNLRAGKPSPNCVEVNWNQAASGACFVKYEIQFINASGTFATRVAYNIGQITVCLSSGKVNITSVRLTMSFKAITKTFTAKVPERPIPTKSVVATTTAKMKLMTQPIPLGKKKIWNKFILSQRF